MQKLRKTLFLALCLSGLAAYGQKSVEETCDIAERMLKEYRFHEVSGMLSAVSADEVTARVDTLRMQAALGETMMQTVADVTFLDCLDAPRETMLRNIPCYAEDGHLLGIDEIKGFSSALCGETAYMNDIGDAIFVGSLDENGAVGISVARKVGESWMEPQPIEGLGDNIEDPCNPFVDSYGTTLYFAARGKESLGGYDIFVTRFDAEARCYLKPQNLGMPFNSPFDEKLYVVNEELGVGYLVTSRGQSADSLAVYFFSLSEDAGLLKADSIGADAVMEYASFREARLSRKGDAQKIIEEWNNSVSSTKSTVSSDDIRLVISDDSLITSVDNLRSVRARRIATEWMKERKLLETQRAELDSLRHIYKKGMSETAQRIMELERIIPEKTLRLYEMEKDIRRVEQEYTGYKYK